MAKRPQNIVKAAKGFLWKSLDVGYNTLNDAVSEVFKCCGPDCCENVYRWKDKDTGDTYVEYVLTGAKVVELESAYKVKKEAGTFNY
jgi:hypothetical protein